MAQALQLAELGRYSTSPNPCVGCVIVKNDAIIGQGWHKQAGTPHAEIHALHAAGSNAKNSTVYVTLEPCCFVGKTGACTEALIAAGVSKVVIAMRDPNPLVSGKGIARLQNAGIKVECGLLQDAAFILNQGFCQRMSKQMPFVTLKLAMSLDGRTAMANGQSKWITSEQSRARVQLLRAKSCAIISGADTVITDNARLNVRCDELNLEPEILKLAKQRQPLRVVIDSKLRIPLDVAFWFEPNVAIATCTKHSPKIKQLQQLGAQILPFAGDKVDLKQLLSQLAQLGCNNVLVEAGANLAAAFMSDNLIDEYQIYVAPKILGSKAKALFNLDLSDLKDAYNLNIIDVKNIGCDLLITANKKR